MEPKLRGEAAHDHWAPLSFVVGEWIGEGRGLDADFVYGEGVTVRWVAKERFLLYESRSITRDGQSSHQEAGLIGWDAIQSRLFAFFAFGDGLALIARGEAGSGREFLWETDRFLAMPPDRHYRALRRTWLPTAGGWEYEVELALGDEPLRPHVRGVLRKPR